MKRIKAIGMVLAGVALPALGVALGSGWVPFSVPPPSFLLVVLLIVAPVGLVVAGAVLLGRLRAPLRGLTGVVGSLGLLIVDWGPWGRGCHTLEGTRWTCEVSWWPI